jgi:hypothetical protein
VAGDLRELRDLLAHGVRADPEPLERLSRHALSGVDEGEQELYGALMVEAEPDGFLAGSAHDLAGVVGEGDEPGDRGVNAGPRPGIDRANEPGGP